MIGKVCCYKYDNTCTDIVESPGKGIGLPDITGSHSACVEIDEYLGLSKIVFEPRLIPGTQIPFPGFPSLNVMPIASVELTPVGLNCVGSPSKYPNMILTMHQMPALPPIEQLAENVLDKSLFVNWPMMHEGKVVAISDETKEIRLYKAQRKITEFSKMASDRWRSEAEIMGQTYYVGNGVPGAGGVQIGEIKFRLKILPLQGMKTNPTNGSTKKMFGNDEADVPLQLALWQAPAPDPRFFERGPMTLKDRFPEGCNVILTKGKFRGCVAQVVAVADKKNVGVRVQTLPAETPFGHVIAQSVHETFMSSQDAARILKMNPGVLGKVMGRLQFEQGRYDLGLNLKSPDGLCVVGYTRKKTEQNGNSKGNRKDDSAWAAGDAVLVVGSRPLFDDDAEEERIQWEYSPKAIRLVEAYRKKFPQLFAALNKKPNERKYDANEVFGPNGEKSLAVVREWLDNHESAKLPRSKVSTELMSYEASAAVEKAASVRALALKKKGYPQEALIKVPGSALYREGSTGATDILLASDLNDMLRPKLGDRIVNLCADGVPFGLRGTVIGVHEAASSGGSVEIVMDQEFMGGTSLQGHCSNFRGKLCQWAHLLKIEPDNSAGVVEKLIPKGASKEAAMNRVLSANNEEPRRRVQSSWDNQVDTARDVLRKKEKPSYQDGKTPPRSSSVSKRAVSKTPPRSTSRSGSTGKSRVAWREARGPDEKGTGFKGAKRGHSSGLAKWKNDVKLKSTANDCVNATADDLKKILGLATTSAPASSTSNATGKSSDHLKAVLGVGASSATPTNQSAQVSVAPLTSQAMASSATIGLKTMLGLPTVASEAMPAQILKRSPAVLPQPGLPMHTQQQTLPSEPLSAADKLRQLMAGKQSQASMVPRPPVQPSGFNFTYVEQGKEAPPPPSQMMPQYHNYPQQQYTSVPMMPMMMPSYGMAPPPPPPAHFLSQGSMHPYQPSTNEFPPLGASINPQQAILRHHSEPQPPKTPTILVPTAASEKRGR
jgi:Exoribonuclease Xrn1 D1 domain/Xrn1 SH3-like domain